MTAATLTREDTQLHTGQNPDEAAHYVRRRHIDTGAVEALCGHVFIPMRDARGLPICQGCKAVYEDDEAMSLASE